MVHLHHTTKEKISLFFSARLRYPVREGGEETPNSDIDLLAIVAGRYLQKRHEVHDGVTVEYVEMHQDVMEDFIAKGEIPMLFALAKGVVLFDKEEPLAPLIAKARAVIAQGPPVNPRWEEEAYGVKKRSDLTEIYSDMLDTEDAAIFGYLSALLLTAALAHLIETHHLWPQTRKKLMPYLKAECPEAYGHIETLCAGAAREAAKGLITCAMGPYGGLLEGDVVVFRKEFR